MTKILAIAIVAIGSTFALLAPASAGPVSDVFVKQMLEGRNLDRSVFDKQMLEGSAFDTTYFDRLGKTGS